MDFFTAILGFLARPFEIGFQRKRTGAINAIRFLSYFLYKYREDLENKGYTSLIKEIDECLKYPNALGSEAQLAKIIGHISSILEISPEEISNVDRALNSLDQRATERERAKNNN